MGRLPSGPHNLRHYKIFNIFKREIKKHIKIISMDTYPYFSNYYLLSIPIYFRKVQNKYRENFIRSFLIDIWDLGSPLMNFQLTKLYKQCLKNAYSKSTKLPVTINCMNKTKKLIIISIRHLFKNSQIFLDYFSDYSKIYDTTNAELSPMIISQDRKSLRVSWDPQIAYVREYLI